MSYESSTVLPPEPAREFRGVWVTTVNNAVWPSSRNLSTQEQKNELLAILDRAAQLNLNAIIFQVRPAGDAFYASKFEPWSEYLTGTMGRPPEPYYDPLGFAVAEAHKRGLELHAWINPYRALHYSSRSAIASNHVSRTRPDLVRRYGRYLWLDPGERDVQDYIITVVMDVVCRYDVDGIHFDDYFYPDGERDASGKSIEFPDEASWKRFGAGRGLSRDEWRRENVNSLIERTYGAIKRAKPWVKFGVSPRGIWRPSHPAQIRGLDAYAKLYADSRKWLSNGWVDYFAPQLYWAIEPKEQSFPVLLKWWSEQNLKGRHLWPGLNSYKVGEGWREREIVDQIRIARSQPGVSGQIHWDMRALNNTRSKLGDVLAVEVYSQPALVPASPWLGTNSVARPSCFLGGQKTGNLRLVCRPGLADMGGQWVIQTRKDGVWKMEVLPGETIVRNFAGFQPEVIAVRRVDRFGNPSVPIVFERK